MRGNDQANTIDGGGGNDVIRGAGGSDTLTGGEGFDRFVWQSRDLLDGNGVHRGVDTLTDFSSDDVLDLSEILEGRSFAQVSDVIQLTENDGGTLVSVKLGQAFVNVVQLDSVSMSDANAAYASGTFLI